VQISSDSSSVSLPSCRAAYWSTVVARLTSASPGFAKTPDSHADWFRVPSIEIASITAELSHKHGSGSKPSLRKWLNDKINRPAPDLFSTGPEPHLASAGRVLESLVTKVSNTTLQGLFECIFREAGIVNVVQSTKPVVRMYSARPPDSDRAHTPHSAWYQEAYAARGTANETASGLIESAAGANVGVTVR